MVQGPCSNAWLPTFGSATARVWNANALGNASPRGYKDTIEQDPGKSPPAVATQSGVWNAICYCRLPIALHDVSALQSPFFLYFLGCAGPSLYHASCNNGTLVSMLTISISWYFVTWKGMTSFWLKQFFLSFPLSIPCHVSVLVMYIDIYSLHLHQTYN